MFTVSARILIITIRRATEFKSHTTLFFLNCFLNCWNIVSGFSDARLGFTNLCSSL